MLHAEARRPRGATPRRLRAARGAGPCALGRGDDRWAEALLRRASALGAIGRYQLEAALQSAHVDRRRTGRANWAAVVQLYDALFGAPASPVVAINRALAIAEIHGAGPRPGAAALAADARLCSTSRTGPPAPSSWRGRVRRRRAPAYDVAIGLERDPPCGRFLQKRQKLSVGRA